MVVNHEIEVPNARREFTGVEMKNEPLQDDRTANEFASDIGVSGGINGLILKHNVIVLQQDGHCCSFQLGTVVKCTFAAGRVGLAQASNQPSFYCHFTACSYGCNLPQRSSGAGPLE